MSKRKPLEPVRVVRSHAVDAEAAQVRAASDALEEARRAVAGAEADARALRGALAAEDAKEQATVRTVLDHQGLAAFRRGAKSRIAAAEAAIVAARARVVVAEKALEDRKRSLAFAQAALEVIEKHQERARETFDREAQERIDEAAEDGFSARLRKRS